MHESPPTTPPTLFESLTFSSNHRLAREQLYTAAAKLISVALAPHTTTYRIENHEPTHVTITVHDSDFIACSVALKAIPHTTIIRSFLTTLTITFDTINITIHASR